MSTIYDIYQGENTDYQSECPFCKNLKTEISNLQKELDEHRWVPVREGEEGGGMNAIDELIDHVCEAVVIMLNTTNVKDESIRKYGQNVLVDNKATLKAEFERLQSELSGDSDKGYQDYKTYNPHPNMTYIQWLKRAMAFLEEAGHAAAQGKNPAEYLATKAPTTLRDEIKRLQSELDSERRGYSCCRGRVNDLVKELFAEKEKHRWIPCSERMPEIVYSITDGIYQYVSMECINDGEYVSPVSFETMDNSFIGYWYDRDGNELENVSHWRQLDLPQPPEEIS